MKSEERGYRLATITQRKDRMPRSLLLLSIGAMINSTGTSFLWPLTAVFVTQVMGRSVTEAGFALFLQAGTGMLGSLIGGAMYDRVGGRWTIGIGIWLAILSVLAVAFYPAWIVYLGMMVVLGFATGMIFPSIYAMAGGLWPEGGQRSFSTVYIWQNLGVAVGASLGGVVAQLSFTYTFLLNALTYLIFFLFLIFGIEEEPDVKGVGRIPAGEDLESNSQKNKIPAWFEGRVLRWNAGFLALLFLGFGFLLTWVPYMQWSTIMSKRMADLGFSLSSYSFLWTVNGALILLLQPPVSRILRRWFPSVKVDLMAGALVFGIAYLLLPHQVEYAGFLVAMGITSIGEILVWPAIPVAAEELSPQGKRGFYQGVINTFATGGRMIGPVLGGFLFDHFGLSLMFSVMTGLYIMALLLFFSYNLLPRWLSHRIGEREGSVAEAAAGERKP